MLKDGRISICALTTSNVAYVAQCINETLRAVPGIDGGVDGGCGRINGVSDGVKGDEVSDDGDATNEGSRANEDVVF